jgi:hypothetical protein
MRQGGSVGGTEEVKIARPTGEAERRNQTVGPVVYSGRRRWAPVGITNEVYPSGTTLSREYSDIGRATAGKKAGTAQNYATGLKWSPWGGLKSRTFGNGQQGNWTWTHRGQPSSAQVGTLLNLGFHNCPDKSAGCGTNNGNLMVQTIGQAGAEQSFVDDAYGRLRPSDGEGRRPVGRRPMGTYL